MAEKVEVASAAYERALRITCALLSNPNVVEPGSDAYLANTAFRLLNAIEERMGLHPTPDRQRG